MAEADPKHLPIDGGGQPKKRKKKKTTFPIPPWKYPQEFEDTAASKPEEEIEEVDYDNIQIMQEILNYRSRKGVFPFSNPDDFRKFCFPYIHAGIGNAAGWDKKLEEMKNKFNSESAPMADIDQKDFELWEKIWGNEGKDDDDDPDVGSSK